MAVINVYKKNETVVHKSYICSKASLVIIITFATAVLVPLVAVFRSHGLWIKEAEYREQPDIRFKYQVLLITETSVGPLIWSSNSIYNDLLKKYLRTPLIKSSEIDENKDGLKDKLDFNLELPLLASELVYGVSVLLVFDYRLQHLCEVALEGAGLLQYSSGLPVTSLYHYADLTLSQRHLLHYGRSNSQYNVSILPTSVQETKEWSMNSILHEYWKRNLTTRFTNTYTSWQNGGTDVLRLMLEIRYPEQSILYKPGFWYIIKWAWIQYFCLLAVVSYIVNLIKDWIFQNSIVSTWVDHSRKKM
ncbi:transmembrane protein 231 [Macrobrachium rosenbergii]|uniref:transmembrane protein 231 n=1 Tax=Macrobrachium rosenbergii TaxID=79674 RepID=UPI0034D5E6D6